jgi:hypothetical protein
LSSHFVRMRSARGDGSRSRMRSNSSRIPASMSLATRRIGRNRSRPRGHPGHAQFTAGSRDIPSTQRSPPFYNHHPYGQPQLPTSTYLSGYGRVRAGALPPNTSQAAQRHAAPNTPGPCALASRESSGEQLHLFPQPGATPPGLCGPRCIIQLEWPPPLRRLS